MFVFICSLWNPRSLWILLCFAGQSPGTWAKRVAHFYPGGAGIARHMTESKPAGLGVGLRPRPGVFSWLLGVRLPWSGFRCGMSWKYILRFRKLIRRIVGSPPGTNWSAQSHFIWHERTLWWITGPVPVEFFRGQKLGAWVLDIHFVQC